MASLFRQMRVTVFVATLGLVMLTGLAVSHAQTTDITSSGLNTEVSAPTTLPNGTINYDITGGSRPGNGPNLFHSFGEFSVGANNIANFLNETALPTSNILSRVTGGNPSSIFGTLQTTNFGAANLYLINPAGVIFGPTAELNVGGSFAASTADYLKMTDGATFSANPAQPTVLSIAPVAAFGFLGPNPGGTITVQGGTVQNTSALTLVGRDIVDGGGNTTKPGIAVTGGTLSNPGGRINLVSVGTPQSSAAARGEINVTDFSPSQGFGFSSLGTIRLSTDAIINTSGNAAGPIFIRTGKLVMDDSSQIRATTFDAPGGNITIEVQSMEMGNTPDGFSQIGEFGPFVDTSSFGNGRGGDISVNATESVTIVSNKSTGFFSSSNSTGDAGHIFISTPLLSLTGRGTINASTYFRGTGAGRGGDITIDVGRLELAGGEGGAASGIASVNSSSTGIGGNVRVLARDSVELLASQIITSSVSSGNAGNIHIITPDLVLSGGNLTSDSAVEGSVQAGNIEIEVERLTMNTIDVPGVGQIGGEIQTRGIGNGGNILLRASDFVSIQDSDIVASSFEGTGGQITITTPTLTMEGDLTTIESQQGSGGSGGRITLNLGSMTVTGGAIVDTINFGAGQGGDITVSATDQIILSGQSSRPELGPTFGKSGFSSQTFGEGNAGSISLNTPNLIIDGGRIVASTGPVFEGFEEGPGRGAAGAITSSVGTLVMKTGGEISSSSTGTSVLAGNAGAITIQGVTGAGSSATSVSLDSSTINTTIAGGNSSSIPATIEITAQTVNLANGSQIKADTSGAAPAGPVTLTATESIALTGGSSASSSSSFGTGNAGEVSLTAPVLTFADSFSSISSTTNNTGDAGSILIDGTTVSVTNGAAINNSTFGAGNAGTVTIRAKETVMIAGEDPATGFISEVASAAIAGTGAAGTVTIAAPTITIADRGSVFTANSPLSGRAGDIALDGQHVTISGGGQVTSGTSSEAPSGTVTVSATESVIITGADSAGNASRIASSTIFGGGNAGQVSVTAPQFTMEGGEITAASLFSGPAGNIGINARIASLTGGAQVETSSIGDGGGGQITLTATDSLLVAGVDTEGISTTIGSSTSGENNAGEITLSAPAMTIADGAFISASSDGAGKAGAVILQAGRLNITDGAQVDSSTFGPGQGGTVTITATEQMRLAGGNDEGPSQITTITAGSGNAGKILVTTPVMDLRGGAIFANTGASGNAGSIMVEAGQLSLANDALIASRGVQTATGDAGSVNLQVRGLFSGQASTVSSEAQQGAGGSVSIMAGDMQLTGGTTISAESAGSEDAGSIALMSATDLLLRNSTVTTFAAQASGGNIKLTAPNLIRLVDSNITSSVEGSTTTVGGNINIDPQLVVIQNSQIRANATAGAGGNITIAASGAVLVDPNSTIDASAGPAGISGSVNINSPIQILSGALVPLNLAYSQAGLSGDRCAADPQGQFSSFVQTGRDGVPQVPGSLSPSPLSFLETLTSGSLGSPWPNVAAARLGLDAVSFDDSTLFRFHSACRS